jgi:hypothetical protein
MESHSSYVSLSVESTSYWSNCKIHSYWSNLDELLLFVELWKVIPVGQTVNQTHIGKLKMSSKDLFLDQYTSSSYRSSSAVVNIKIIESRPSPITIYFSFIKGV